MAGEVLAAAKLSLHLEAIEEGVAVLGLGPVLDELQLGVRQVMEGGPDAAADGITLLGLTRTPLCRLCNM